MGWSKIKLESCPITKLGPIFKDIKENPQRYIYPKRSTLLIIWVLKVFGTRLCYQTTWIVNYHMLSSVFSFFFFWLNETFIKKKQTKRLYSKPLFQLLSGRMTFYIHMELVNLAYILYFGYLLLLSSYIGSGWVAKLSHVDYNIIILYYYYFLHWPW